MKVKELIAELQKYDPEATVTVADTEGCWYPSTDILLTIGMVNTKYYENGQKQPDKDVLVLGYPL